MLRRKKFIIVGLLATVLLVGSISSGVAFAQTETGDASQSGTLLARVAEILGIDQQKVEDAFAQAQSEMRDEALDSYLQKLVDEGTITQEQADQYKAWQQARPDISPELKEWQEARPDMPLPGPFGRFGDRGIRGGMKWGGGRCFWGR
ncbi:hypothetical protein ACFLYG_02255 [Chloroflexota bacterium]